MKALAYLGLNIVLSLFRVLPLAQRTGLYRIGRPGADAPVVVTGNYVLTVARVKRALAGMDAYLLVADSRGVNVWCAATGGLLSTHDVISVLKTSGIEHLVRHRRVILPQLAATGVETQALERRTGWKVVWGPVEAAAIAEFVARGMEKTRAMRTVAFPWPRRLEMVAAWACPISLLALAVLFPLWRQAVAPVTALIWAIAAALFLAFPLFRRRLERRQRGTGLVFFDFASPGAFLGVWALAVVAGVAYATATGEPSGTFLIKWGVASVVVLLVLSLDLSGSTPVYKSGLHPDRMLRIELDEERCKGAGWCVQVCPVDVFVLDSERHLARLPGRQRCVQCGACVVQCPFDALRFREPSGGLVDPETVRRFKLNLIGKRARPAPAPTRRTDGEGPPHA